MKLFIDLLSLVIGILLYRFMAGDDYSDVGIKVFFCVFGGAYIGIKYKVWEKD